MDCALWYKYSFILDSGCTLSNGSQLSGNGNNVENNLGRKSWVFGLSDIFKQLQESQACF